MRRRVLLAAALGAAFAAAPASAQGFDNKRPMGETASDAAFGFCPLLLAGQLDLKNNEMLVSRGFSATPESQPSERFGPLETVQAAFPGGAVGFGGASGKVCMVILAGKGRAEAAKAVREALPLFAIKLQPDAANSGPKRGGQVEAFSGEADANSVLHMQIITMPDDAQFAITAFQFYLTAK